MCRGLGTSPRAIGELVDLGEASWRSGCRLNQTILSALIESAVQLVDGSDSGRALRRCFVLERCLHDDLWKSLDRRQRKARQ
jgi:hypothetical protein